MKTESNNAREAYRRAPLFRTLVTSFSIVAILSCVSIGVLTYNMRATDIRSEQYSLLETLRDEKIANMSTWYDERVSDSNVVALRPDIINFCQAHPANDGDDHEPILTALRTIQSAYSYKEVFLTNAQGHTIANTETEIRTSGSLPLREAAIQKVIEKETNVVSDVLISKVDGKPEVFFFFPIREPQTSEVIGTVGTLVDPSVLLYPQFTASKHLGETGEILLVNTDGLVQSPLKYREGAISAMRIQAEPAVRGAAGKFGIIADDDYRGESVMAAFGYMKEFDWGIVVKQDMREINAPVRAMARGVLNTSLGVLLLALIFGWIVARRISRPIRGIDAVVRRFADGELDARCSVEGSAETANLGMAYNEMLGNLSSQMAVRQGYAKLSETMVNAGSIEDFASELLRRLLELSDSNLGAFYLLDENEDVFERFTSVGLSADSPTTFSAGDYEGEFGKAVATGGIALIQGISKSAVFTFKTTVGTVIPREILTVPLLVDHGVKGIVSLATMGRFSDTFKQTLDLAQSGIGSAFSNLLASTRTKQLADDLVMNNDELQAQAREMERQADELKRQTVELEAQRLQVETADRLKSEFLSNMSHELRTPLNSVLSLSQLMLSNGIGARGGEDRERIEIIERNGRHLLHLINDILDLSKIEAGRADLYISSFATSEPVDEVVESIYPLANEKGLSIEVETGEMGEMQTDRDKLKQVLLNLVSNACKFTNEGEVGIKIRQDGRSVIFTVWDTGIGISGKALPHIFDEFRQADGSTTREFGGTGLGLAISQRLASLLGGKIEVESEEGRGSTFVFTLPMRIEERGLHAYQPSEFTVQAVAKWQTGAEPPHILLVEDNQVAREQITSVLASSGFVVATAVDGEDGLVRTREHVPDGMILDLMMPKIDGFQVLDAIRSTAETEHLPVLVLTAKELTAEERASLSYNNVHQLIQKGSIDRDQLVNSVRKLVGMEPESIAKESVMEKTVQPTSRRKDGTLSVLVVDDNADNLSTTRAILNTHFGDQGLEIFEARNGEAAVAVASAEQPDIILMDIQMPVMSGIEATRRIRQDENLQNTPVIALTASAMSGDREEILAAGLDDYLSKPVEPEALKTVIRKWIV